MFLKSVTKVIFQFLKLLIRFISYGKIGKILIT